MYYRKTVRPEGQLILMAEPIPHPKRPPRTPSRRSSFSPRTDGQRPMVNSETRISRFVNPNKLNSLIDLLCIK